jgi:hypothetical protein
MAMEHHTLCTCHLRREFKESIFAIARVSSNTICFSPQTSVVDRTAINQHETLW